MPWDRNRLTDDEPVAGFAIHYVTDVSGDEFARPVCIGTWMEAPDKADIRSLWTRFVCHFLVGALPERSLTELVETLRDMWEFYVEPTTPAPSLLAPQRMKASLGETSVHPGFQLETED